LRTVVHFRAAAGGFRAFSGWRGGQ
jgi:hypothetical protein